MRNLFVTVLVLALIVPASAHAAGTQQPIVVEPSEPGCEECSYSRYTDNVSCNPGGREWINCEGGWIILRDGSGESTRVPNCGERCYYA
jgi:hypothetical protein